MSVLLALPEVVLILDEVLLEGFPGLHLIIVRPSFTIIFLIMTYLSSKAVRNSYKMDFYEALSRCCCRISTLIKPLGEDLEQFLGIVFRLHVGIIFHIVYCRDVGIVSIKMMDDIESGAQ